MLGNYLLLSGAPLRCSTAGSRATRQRFCTIVRFEDLVAAAVPPPTAAASVFFKMDQDTNGALAALRHYGWADAPKKFIAKLLTLPAFWILVALLVFGLGLTVALLGYQLNLV